MDDKEKIDLETCEIEAGVESISKRLRQCQTTLEVVGDLLHVMDDVDNDLLEDVDRWLEDVERTSSFLLAYITRVFDNQSED